MTAAEHLRRAIALQRRAEELQVLARRIESEATGLGGWFHPVGTRLLPHVWAGPAADRATEGYWQARHRITLAVELLTTRVASIRARAEVLLEDAAQHVRDAAAIEAAARKAAADAAAAAAAAAADRASTARRACRV